MRAARLWVIGLVVQSGVEFGHDDVIHYAPEKARELSRLLADLPGIVFEAHSTDYQADAGLRQLVVDGFCILKVGPWLTFALREVLYGLDALADVLDGQAPRHRLMQAMEDVMQAAPTNWASYYRGSDRDLWVRRHFSYSDRIRYFWPDAVATAAVGSLRQQLAGRAIPDPVLRQYLPNFGRVPEGADVETILNLSVEAVFETYRAAIHG